MTDQPANSMLVTPPTRMTPSDDAVSEQDTPTDTESKPVSDPTVSTQAVKPNAIKSLTETADTEKSDATGQPPMAERHQPIPPASEPMQYRAIGLVRGKYTPSIEQFTRGFILTDDGVLIDAVLLGRVMSLVKKHLNLEESHLWVVYPRTREKDLELHMQIVGVWEPEKLNRPTSMDMDDSAEAEADLEEEDEIDEADETDETDETDKDSELEEPIQAEAAPVEPIEAVSDQPTSEQAAGTPDQADAVPSSDLDDRYFSVRGEIVYQSEEEERLLVKIRRAPKQGSTQAKAFKVALKGTLAGKALGYFWDLQVQRENNELVIKEATQIGMVPPQKRGSGEGGRPPRRFGGGGPRRGGPGSGPPRRRFGDREDARPARGERPLGSDRPSGPPTPRQPVSKPVIKRRQKDEES